MFTVQKQAAPGGLGVEHLSHAGFKHGRVDAGLSHGHAHLEEGVKRDGDNGEK